MATESDLTQQRDNDVQVLDEKIMAAISIKNGLDVGDPQRVELSTVINQLMDSRTDLHIQVLVADLNSSQLKAALAKIKKAGDDLKREAAKMKSATTFIGNANAVIGAATNVINVFKKGG